MGEDFVAEVGSAVEEGEVEGEGVSGVGGESPGTVGRVGDGGGHFDGEIGGGLLAGDEGGGAGVGGENFAEEKFAEGDFLGEGGSFVRPVVVDGAEGGGVREALPEGAVSFVPVGTQGMKKFVFFVAEERGGCKVFFWEGTRGRDRRLKKVDCRLKKRGNHRDAEEGGKKEN